jgi:beta-carotene 3-hydroxylase
VSFVAPVLVATVAFAVMEPVTWAAHRFVMHGRGWALHRSHHAPGAGWFEANDLYPVVFASLVMGALWLGFHVPSVGWFVPASVGVTLYGVAYALVHDGAVHGRIPVDRLLPRGRPAWLQRLVAAHLVHHRTGGEPFGMLLPHVPQADRAVDGRAVSRL